MGRVNNDKLGLEKGFKLDKHYCVPHEVLKVATMQ